MDQKTVFISYRRSQSKHLARAIYQDLKANGWDAFLDVNTIDSGDFDRIILNQIGARAHFVLLISPGSLERCAKPGDWVLREIEEAVRLERNIVPVIEEGVDYNAEMGYLPDALRDMVSKKNGLPLNHFYFDAGMDMLRTRFLRAPEYIEITEAPEADHAEVQRRLDVVNNETTAVVDAPGSDHDASWMTADASHYNEPEDLFAAPQATRTDQSQTNTSESFLPAPFAWIEISAGEVISAHVPQMVAAFAIAKYPVTNLQFSRFVDSNGYHDRRWWSDEAWIQLTRALWKLPKRWRSGKWNGDHQPVVGISWYEAAAFCRWLSEVRQESIMLPKEAQWQRAAQGDDDREYPWGNDWYCKNCNNAVPPCKSAQVTTNVQLYEGIGDSPFGIVDMAGNVFEWCVISDRLEPFGPQESEKGVLRGGSWVQGTVKHFSVANRVVTSKEDRSDNVGFRIVRNYD